MDLSTYLRRAASAADDAASALKRGDTQAAGRAMDDMSTALRRASSAAK